MAEFGIQMLGRRLPATLTEESLCKNLFRHFFGAFLHLVFRRKIVQALVSRA
ncbi:hypothetical protein AWB68_05735 [Caballeronia choica]|jgi:hypothetical protein|uniref:Uncharacterized protein n=1 Tax=Caballeronia choica TaxID=326476 RepID=A0A158KFQ7_9BURK|nr:hypothetical protein AWB68_05735 [Caballeronia choica]